MSDTRQIIENTTEKNEGFLSKAARFTNAFMMGIGIGGISVGLAGYATASVVGGGLGVTIMTGGVVVLPILLVGITAYVAYQDYKEKKEALEKLNADILTTENKIVFLQDSMHEKLINEVLSLLCEFKERGLNDVVSINEHIDETPYADEMKKLLKDIVSGFESNRNGMDKNYSGLPSQEDFVSQLRRSVDHAAPMAIQNSIAVEGATSIIKEKIAVHITHRRSLAAPTKSIGGVVKAATFGFLNGLCGVLFPVSGFTGLLIGLGAVSLAAIPVFGWALLATAIVVGGIVGAVAAGYSAHEHAKSAAKLAFLKETKSVMKAEKQDCDRIANECHAKRSSLALSATQSELDTANKKIVTLEAKNQELKSGEYVANLEAENKKMKEEIASMKLAMEQMRSTKEAKPAQSVHPLTDTHTSIFDHSHDAQKNAASQPKKEKQTEHETRSPTTPNDHHH